LVGLRLIDRPRIVDYRRRAALATAVAAVRDDNDAK
jgi:hypothetical protein